MKNLGCELYSPLHNDHVKPDLSEKKDASTKILKNMSVVIEFKATVIFDFSMSDQHTWFQLAIPLSSLRVSCKICRAYFA